MNQFFIDQPFFGADQHTKVFMSVWISMIQKRKKKVDKRRWTRSTRNWRSTRDGWEVGRWIFLCDLISTTDTRRFSDFDDTFRVWKALSSKSFQKKRISEYSLGCRESYIISEKSVYLLFFGGQRNILNEISRKILTITHHFTCVRTGSNDGPKQDWSLVTLWILMVHLIGRFGPTQVERYGAVYGPLSGCSNTGCILT